MSLKKSAKKISKKKSTKRLSFLGLNLSRKQTLQKNRHKSFRLSKRHDYARSLSLPGYVAFTVHVIRTLFDSKRLFIGVLALYSLLIIIFGGISDQRLYDQLDEVFGGGGLSVFDTISQAGLAALLGFAGNGSAAVSDVQQVYIGITVLLVWLTSVWLMRELMAGRKPRLRDGIYNSGSPIVATALLVIVLLIQLLPLGILAVAYTGLAQVGLVADGLGAMLFFAVAALTCALCLYWITATFIALVVVTLPGMYPIQALRVANELVLGRRLRIMYRIIWLLLLIIAFVLIVVAPVILLDHWLRSLAEWVSVLPVIPVTYALVGATVAVFSASYVYILYRKVVAYDSETDR